MAHLHIGTSGWVYRSWKGPFYPDTLPSRRNLAFYAQEFRTTEINSSFYHLPAQPPSRVGRSKFPRILFLR